jgi:hypothetical protein
MKNVVNRQHLLFTKTWRHSKFGCILCKIRWEKYPRAFVEVVEGSEIYNFAIYSFMHFSSSFGRKARSKSPKSKHSRWARRRAATSRQPERRARRARHASGLPPPRRLGPTDAPSRGTRAPSPGCTRPELPQKSPPPPHYASAVGRTSYCPPVLRESLLAPAPRGTAVRAGTSRRNGRLPIKTKPVRLLTCVRPSTSPCSAYGRR